MTMPTSAIPPRAERMMLSESAEKGGESARTIRLMSVHARAEASAQVTPNAGPKDSRTEPTEIRSPERNQITKDESGALGECGGHFGAPASNG